MRRIFLSFWCILSLAVFATAQDQHGHDNHDGHNHAEHADHSGQDHADHSGHAHANACGYTHEDVFNPGAVAFHHISDQNIYSIGPVAIPLPCIMYVKDQGLEMFSSGVFEADSHGSGIYAYNRWVIYEGSVRRILDKQFPMGKVAIGEHNLFPVEETMDNGKKRDVIHLCYEGEAWRCDSKSYADGGFLGGGMSSYYDFSITKNVMTMLIVFILVAWVFIRVARAYKKREGLAPTGTQNLLETLFVFIQDEVAKPFLGAKWERYTPFLMSLFFFILALNLFGQIPFFGGSNVTGNLSFTLVIAVLAFVVTTFSGNKHYWEHIFWMPGLPAWVKVIITPVEIMGMFIKPLTLMLRLFGNITAGHMVIVIFVGLIFIFGQNGANPGAAYGTAIGSTLLTMFMMAIELLVAFLQAFVFTILTASYIGAAIEDHHHAEEAH